MKRILLLGATGSIGDSAVAVVENLPEELEIVALAAGRNWRRLVEIAERHRPRAVALDCAEAAAAFARATAYWDPSPKLYSGADGLVQLVEQTEGDVVLGAISGAAGLLTSVAALESGKDLALANKESLVTSGALLMQLARANHRRIIPVDSEHSAIFQSLLAGRPEEVESIILTASGGPFRQTPAEKLRTVTKAEALNHPTWKNMGAKITIDSATLMNKALEIIEARWLFDVSLEQIRVVVHPQSIIHSLVQFRDGSMICQVGPPDMKIPIQYALTYPHRAALPVARTNLADIGTLSFFEADPERFPAIRLAYEVLARGGTAPTVFNAANEVAVAAFLREDISFLEISAAVERTLGEHARQSEAGTLSSNSTPSLDEILRVDAWAREEAKRQLETTAR